MTEYCNNSLMSSMINIDATYFFEEKTPTIIKKQLSSFIVIDTIRNSIIEQFQYTFGSTPEPKNLEMLVDGFILFNLHKNKYMLKNKETLLKYVEDPTNSIEELQYFLDIFLYNKRPTFLSAEEHEYLRACGNLEGYNIHKSGSYKEFCEKRIKNGKIIMEQEQEQEDEEDLFEIEIDDVLYLANDDENGILYEMTSDGDVGKKIGIIKDGEPIFQEDKICYIESQFSDTQKYLKQRDYPDEFYDMPIGTKVYGKIWDGQDYQTDEEYIE